MWADFYSVPPGSRLAPGKRTTLEHLASAYHLSVPHHTVFPEARGVLHSEEPESSFVSWREALSLHQVVAQPQHRHIQGGGIRALGDGFFQHVGCAVIERIGALGKGRGQNPGSVAADLVT